MRFGAYERCSIPRAGSPRFTAPAVSASATHRYEVNIAYRDTLEEAGLRVFGHGRQTGLLPEMSKSLTIPGSSACEFHPELKSQPVRAAPALSRHS
jgi:CTP synthase